MGNSHLMLVLAVLLYMKGLELTFKLLWSSKAAVHQAFSGLAKLQVPPVHLLLLGVGLAAFSWMSKSTRIVVEQRLRFEDALNPSDKLWRIHGNPES